MQVQRYKSLIDNCIYVSRGSFRNGDYLEFQVRANGTGTFTIVYTDGHEYTRYDVSASLTHVKAVIRSFVASTKMIKQA